MLAWLFVGNDKRLCYGDRRLVEVGETLECEGDPELCVNGLHGSVRLIDALKYANGPIVCRVEIDGDVIEGHDKLCGRRRTVLWMLDATDILNEFACQCARDAGELDFAGTAAWPAAWDTAVDAAMDATLYAARAASREAARAAVRDAGMVAAWDAAWDVAWDDEWNRQNNRLTEMVMAAHKKGADQE